MIPHSLRTTSTLLIIAAVGATLPCSRASAARTYAVNQIAPPAHVIEGVRTLHVAAFEGHGGADLAVGIRGALVAGRGTYTELGLSWDDGLKTDVFQVVDAPDAADAVLRGSVEVVDGAEWWTEERVVQAGVTTDIAVEDLGSFSAEVSGTVPVNVHCAQHSVGLVVRWTVTSAAGDVLAGGTLESDTAAADCGWTMEEVDTRSTEAMANELLAWYPHAVANEIAPYWVSRDFATGGFDNDAVDDAFEGDYSPTFGDVYCSLQALVAENTYDMDPVFGLGLVHEMFGQFDLAQARYERVREFTGGERASSALHRMDVRQGEIAILARAYGLTFVPQGPFTECDRFGLLPRMQLDDDAKLYDGPDPKNATVLAELPEDMLLGLVERQGRVAHVVTPDGVEGWVLWRHLDEP